VSFKITKTKYEIYLKTKIKNKNKRKNTGGVIDRAMAGILLMSWWSFYKVRNPTEHNN